MAKTQTDTAAAPPAAVVPGKVQALGTVVDTLEPLSRTEQLEILKAAAILLGLTVLLELPR